MHGEPRSGIFKHTEGVPEYRKRSRLSAANMPRIHIPAATRGRCPGRDKTIALFDTVIFCAC